MNGWVVIGWAFVAAACIVILTGPAAFFVFCISVARGKI